MTKVARSIYQKAIEENKRLLSDIKLLVSEECPPEKILCIKKWQDKFRDEREFDDMLRQMVRVNH